MPDNPPILDYGKEPRRRSIVPMLGIVFCGTLAIIGVSIIGFAVWNLIYGARSAESLFSNLSNSAAIFLTGILLIGMSVKWLRAARRQHLAERTMTYRAA